MTTSPYKAFLSDYPKIEELTKFTKTKLLTLRKELNATLNDSPNKQLITIVTTGSYGRGEASDESDIDLFIFFDSDQSTEKIQPELKKIKNIIDNHVPNSTGDTGTFGSNVVIHFSGLIGNIGGEDDTNQNMTRRVLLLLEGTWLFGKDRFKGYRKQLLNKYLDSESISDDVSRFFLNDIIRFYRTMTTDFEHKISTNSKSWGLRSVKLRYSRKLLYFGGIIAVGSSVATGENDKKIQHIESLLDLPALERVFKLSNKNEDSQPIFKGYDEFLKTISDPKKRCELDALQREDRTQSSVYMEIRGSSKEFSGKLDTWIKQKFDAKHPIHIALLF